MKKPTITNRLPEVLSATERRLGAALLQSAVVVGSHAAAKTPVDTSTLINSQFARVDRRGSKLVATIGYTAEYALAVHEASGKLAGLPRPKRDGKKHGVFWGPGRREPEFLLKGAQEAEPLIRAQIIAAARPRNPGQE